MLRYLPILGWTHTVIGGLGTMFGAACTTLALLMLLYGVYDFVHGLIYLMAGPQYIGYALENLMQVATLSAMIAVPAVVVLALYGVELFAGVGMLRRWPRARIAGMLAVIPGLVLGLPGILLGVGTVVVLNDDEVKAALAG